MPGPCWRAIMILLCGIPSEPPLGNVSSALQQIKMPYLILNQRNVLQTWIEFKVNQGHVTGWLESDGHAFRLESFDAVYVRFMDDRYLPEIRNESPNSELRVHSRLVHEALMSWLEVSQC